MKKHKQSIASLNQQILDLQNKLRLLKDQRRESRKKSALLAPKQSLEIEEWLEELEAFWQECPEEFSLVYGNPCMCDNDCCIWDESYERWPLLGYYETYIFEPVFMRFVCCEYCLQNCEFYTKVVKEKIAEAEKQNSKKFTSVTIKSYFN
jgi:hypothetical protein